MRFLWWLWFILLWLGLFIEMGFVLELMKEFWWLWFVVVVLSEGLVVILKLLLKCVKLFKLEFGMWEVECKVVDCFWLRLKFGLGRLVKRGRGFDLVVLMSKEEGEWLVVRLMIVVVVEFWFL